MTTFSQTLVVPEKFSDIRADKALAELVPEHSRARLTEWLKNGKILINGKTHRPKDKLTGGEQVDIEVEFEPQVEYVPQAIELDIVYEDDDIMVINKPAGLVVHPAAGNWEGTLLNGLLHHASTQVNLPRAGIVHRLDKDTTGLMVVAKTPEAHTALVEQLQARSVSRIYLALVTGEMVAGKKIDAPIGRHPIYRQKMAVATSGKEAITEFSILKHYEKHSLCKVKLQTGRTHQIRVHMSHDKHPIVGDKIYGYRPHYPKAASQKLKHCLAHFPRQALHAWQLSLVHPRTGKVLEWQANLPEDFKALIGHLDEHQESHHT